MNRYFEIAADNLALWREAAAQNHELRLLQAQEAGAEAARCDKIEQTAKALWKKEMPSFDLPTEQLAFARGALQELSSKAFEKHVNDLPPLAAPPTAPRVVFLDSPFGREALKRFEPLLPHLLPITASSFTAVCEELYGDRADFAILPLEDSREGRLLHLYEEIDRFELRITYTCEVSYVGEGRTVLMALVSHRYAPSARFGDELLLDCTLLAEDPHTLTSLLCAANACHLSLCRADTLPFSYGEDMMVYHLRFCPQSKADEQLFSLYLELFQPRAHITARYLHLKEKNHD